MKNRLSNLAASLKKVFQRPARPASSTMCRRAYLTVESLEERQMMSAGLPSLSAGPLLAASPSASPPVQAAVPLPDIQIVRGEFPYYQDTSKVRFRYRSWADGADHTSTPIRGSFDVGLYRSAQPTFDTSATLISKTTVQGGPGGSYGSNFYSEKWFCFSAPLKGDPSQPYLLVVADPYKKITETNENNNVASFVLPTITLKLLDHVESSPGKYSVYPREKLTFQAVVTPSGQSMGGMWLSSKPINRTYWSDAPVDKPSIPPTWTMTPDAAGKFLFKAQTLFPVATESQPITVEVKTPDLQMNSAQFNFHLSCKQGQVAGVLSISAVVFRYTTRADGSVPNTSGPMSRDHEVGLYRSAKPVFDSSAVLIGFGPVRGTETSSQFKFSTPLPFDSSRPWLLVVADPNNRIQETNESNNVASLSYNQAVARILAGEGNCFAGAYLLAFGQLPENLVNSSDCHMGWNTLDAALKAKTGGAIFATIDPQGKKVASNLPAQGVFVARIGTDHAVYVTNGVAIDFVIGRGFGAHFGQGALSPLDEVRWKYNPDASDEPAQHPWLYKPVTIYKLS
jgi:hypothetical protein